MGRSDQTKAPSQRQLRVGEEIRHAVADIITRNEIHEPAFESLSITVSEVRISPDLKNANVYVTPLAGGGDGALPIIKRLNEIAPTIRKVLNKKVVLKYSPKLYFKLDKSFEEAFKINLLLNEPRVQRDIESAQDDDTSEHDSSQ